MYLHVAAKIREWRRVDMCMRKDENNDKNVPAPNEKG
jgi:hypothetical protein